MLSSIYLPVSFEITFSRLWNDVWYSFFLFPAFLLIFAGFYFCPFLELRSSNAFSE